MKRKFLVIALISPLLLLSVHSVQAQQLALLVHSSDAAQPVATNLSNVRHLTFSGANAVVTHSLGANSYDLANVKKLTFANAEQTAVKPLTSNFDAVAYCNAAGNVVVECSEEILSLALFDVNGKKISAALAPTSSLNTANVPAGVYILQIQSTQGVITKKIIKN